MFRIIKFEWLFRWLAIGTTTISLLVYVALQVYLGTEFSFSLLLKIAGWTSFVLIMCLTTDIPARLIWGCARVFNKRLFPDLNGTWEGEIIVSETLMIPARAVIRHSLLKVQIDIHTETSKSVTIETTPTLEFNQHKVITSIELSLRTLTGASTRELLHLISDQLNSVATRRLRCPVSISQAGRL